MNASGSNSTTWRRFVTAARPSRLLSLLGLTVAIKLAVLAFCFQDASSFMGLSALMSAPGLAATPAQAASAPPAPVAAQPAAASDKTPDKAPDKTGDKTKAGPQPASAPVPAAAAAPAPAADLPTIEALRRKQDELGRREIALKSMEKELTERLEKLQAIETQIKTMLEQADAMRDQKLKHLIEAYGAMKPKQAADVIATLDEPVAVRILSGMKGKQAGEILNFVEPKQAAKLSVALTKLQTPFQN